jgi:hypothetical protein
MKRRNQTPPKKLPESEWKLHSVPEDEASFCFWHEFGRNSEEFKSHVRAWRERNAAVFDASRRLVNSIKAGSEHTSETRKVFEEAFLAFQRTVCFGSSNEAYPDGLSRTDHRWTLYYFPPFPNLPWQKIAEPIRKQAFIVLSPDIHPAMLPTRDLSNTITAQKRIQDLAQASMTGIGLSQSARQQLVAHIYAPPLVQAEAFGAIPVSSQFDKQGKRVWAGGCCREQVSFIVNWAWGNKKIVTAFRQWLKRRPHRKFEQTKATQPREHLKKLGALRILNSGVSAYQAADYYPLYSSPEQYRKAKREAKMQLQEHFPAYNT